MARAINSTEWLFPSVLTCTIRTNSTICWYTFKRLSPRWCRYSLTRLTTHDSRPSFLFSWRRTKNEPTKTKKTPSVQPNIPFCLSPKRPHAKDSASQNWKRGVRRFLRRKGSTSILCSRPEERESAEQPPNERRSDRNYHNNAHKLSQSTHCTFHHYIVYSSLHTQFDIIP